MLIDRYRLEKYNFLFRFYENYNQQSNKKKLQLKVKKLQKTKIGNTVMGNNPLYF